MKKNKKNKPIINILHLSQTDIRSDSRILKEMNSIAKSNNSYNLIGIGIGRKKNNKNFSVNNPILSINSINVFFRDIKYLPKVISHLFLTIEIITKMLRLSLQAKPSVIHCHDTPVLPLGILIKFFIGSKIVYDAHELESNRNGLSTFLGSLVLFVERKFWPYIDRLIVVSPSIKKWYIKNVGKKACTVILNSPIIVNNKNKNKSYFRNIFSIPIKAKIFLYIGIVGPGRGIDLILDSFINNSNNAHLIFLGYGEYKKKLLKISSKNLNIHFHDAVPHDQVVSIASGADVGICLIENVSLSDFYCLPNKLFEYAFSEIPVLASNFPDISYIVKRYKLGICSDLNKKSIQKSISELTELDKLPKVNLKNLYDLSWEAQEKKLIKMYANLFNK